MRSRKVLGAIALSAVVVAAISFAVVDVTTSEACSGMPDACGSAPVPAAAIGFAAIGAIALLVAIVPTVIWIIRSVHDHRGAHHTSVDYRRGPSAPVRDDEFTDG
ncbi:hypothetical protein FVQ89_10900 [Homoserinibacter sp. GY 40078]|nr:hypothetical protein FVQ89_10900 [Homoserinibacter sp. GY 40078]